MSGFCCPSCFCVDIIFISLKLVFCFPAVPAVYNELGHLPIFFRIGISMRLFSTWEWSGVIASTQDYIFKHVYTIKTSSHVICMQIEATGMPVDITAQLCHFCLSRVGLSYNILTVFWFPCSDTWRFKWSAHYQALKTTHSFCIMCAGAGKRLKKHAGQDSLGPGFNNTAVFPVH